MDCLLCLQSTQDVEKCIKVESLKWEEFCIQQLIEKHLWPIDNIPSKSCLCSTCWEELNDFHRFYTRIEEAHNDFKSLLKTETDPLEEENKPKDLLLENLLEPEIVIGQTLDMAIVIKQENEEPTVLPKDAMSDSGNENHNDGGGTEFQDYDRSDSDMSDDSDNDDDFPLIQSRSKSSANTRSKSKSPNVKDNSNSELDPLQPTDDKPTPDSKDETERKSTPARKSYYQPKTNRLEQDKFLLEHFKIVCNKCQKSFETFRDLCKHYSQEYNERAFVTCCEMKFFNRRFLVDHINYHLDPEYFKCKQCGKVFQKRRCMSAHMKSHEDMKYSCDGCDKKFVDKSKLERHKLTHLTEEEKKFPCKECGKFFGNEYVLTLHERVVHLNIYAKVCEICGQTMSDSNSFKRHMEKHDTTSQPPSYKCDECGLLLSGKRTLKRHKDLKHPADGKRDYTCHVCMKVSPNMKALKKHIQSMHEMGYNFKCTVCEKAFKRADNLKAHMSTHTGTPLYRCPWCPKEFNSNGNMHHHRKKAHPVEWEEARRKKYSGNLPPNFKPAVAGCDLSFFWEEQRI